MKNKTCDLINNKDILFLETNNQVLGHVCKIFKDSAKCKDIMESQKIIGLLGCLASIMYGEESDEIEVVIEMPTNNHISHVAEIIVTLDPISLLSDEINVYNEMDINLTSSNLNNPDDLGKILKKAVSNLILNSNDMETFRKNVFLNIIKLVSDGRMASKFNIKMPISNNLISMDFNCNIDEIIKH